MYMYIHKYMYKYMYMYTYVCIYMYTNSPYDILLSIMESHKLWMTVMENYRENPGLWPL